MNGTPCSLVELTISCKNLINKDVMSKSDPCCIVYLKNGVRNTYAEVGRTETIMNNLNPEFSRKIKLTYMFEERQLLKFDIYDIDSDSQVLSAHDFLGSAEASLGEIVSSSGLVSFERPLVIPGKAKTGSTIKLFVEELSESREQFTFQFSATNLPSSFFGGSNRYFYEIHKSMENNSLTLVHRNVPVLGKKKVEWNQMQISSLTLCNADLDRNLRISLFKYKTNGSHKNLGTWNVTVRGLLDESKRTFKGQGSIEFQLVSFSKDSHATFMDFVRLGSVQLHCFIAIDFTASNGIPTQPNSLHFINPNGFNQYQVALKAVLDIIQDYDSDKMFPALGFGALVPPAMQVSHEFFLNLHPSNPYCAGIDGVMAAYQQALYSVRLHGPTNFAPVINHVARFAASNNDGKNYFILLIITDGVITDMAATTDAVVAASSLPVSIIIVGVGQEDFSAMDALDADEKPLIDSRGCRMERDIVQFVPITEILRKSNNNLAIAQIELAREVLAEIPQQFLSYMKKVGMTPDKLAAGR